MKKYFVKKTGEEIKAGDHVSVDVVKQYKNKKFYRTIEFDVPEDTDLLEELIDSDIIGVKEVPDEEDNIKVPPMVDFGGNDFDEDKEDNSDIEDEECPMEYLLEDFEKLEKKVEKLENDIKFLQHTFLDMSKLFVAHVYKDVKEDIDSKKPTDKKPNKK